MKLKLVEKIFINPETTSFLFNPEEAIAFKPGQFLRYHIPNPSPDQRGENRFFSISSAPFEGVIRLTTKFVPGNGSTFKKDLQKMNIGDTIEAFGPSGSFTLEDPGRHHVFISGGIGITPFRSTLLDLDHQNKPLDITLLYANRTKDILFKDELETLAKKHPEFKLFFFISEQEVKEQQKSENIKIIPGKIDETFIKFQILNFKFQIFYISGPEPMVLSFMEMLVGIGVPKENIKRDEFPGYEQY